MILNFNLVWYFKFKLYYIVYIESQNNMLPKCTCSDCTVFQYQMKFFIFIIEVLRKILWCLHHLVASCQNPFSGYISVIQETIFRAWFPLKTNVVVRYLFSGRKTLTSLIFCPMKMPLNGGSPLFWLLYVLFLTFRWSSVKI